MLNLLFWNINGNPRAVPLLAEAVRERNVNIAVVAEGAQYCGAILDSLGAATGTGFTAAVGPVNERIAVFSRGPVVCLHPIVESNYITVRPVQVPERKELLLAAMHGISQLEDELLDLNEEACNAAQLLREAEVKRGHRRTVAVGDFNLNPFDHGMAKAKGFYAVMSQQDAERGSRRLKHNDYPLFYNPMWSRLGDTSVGPPGTFYRDKTSHLTYYWHTCDQVLVRPELLPSFAPERLCVLDRIGNTLLLDGGRPNASVASDHLPVFLGLHLQE